MISKCWLFRFWGRGRLTAWETTVLGQTAPLPGHTWFPPRSAVLLFVLHCLKRHCHPSYSMQLVTFATSQIAFVEAAESKASTICLINNLWSFYERLSLSLHQGQWANLMFNFPSSLYLQLHSRQGGQAFTVTWRLWKNLNVTVWKGQEKEIHHVERQRTPFLEIQVDRRERLSFHLQENPVYLAVPGTPPQKRLAGAPFLRCQILEDFTECIVAEIKTNKTKQAFPYREAAMPLICLQSSTGALAYILCNFFLRGQQSHL